MISTDAKIFEEGSQVRARVSEYGTLFSELHIIVFTTRGNGDDARAEITKNVFAYPTNSISKLLCVTDAVKIGVSIITNSKFLPTDSVITTQDPFETGLVGEKLSEKFGIPLHIQIHTDFYSPYFKNSLRNRIRIAVSNKTLPHARAIRVVSERIKNSLSQNLQAKTAILPIFADLSAIKNLPINTDLKKKYPQFKKIVLMASRLTREKDISTAITAFSAILGNYPDTGLVIVGSGPEEKNLQKEIFVSDSIIHLPWADYDTLISYMKTCDIFLSTSLYEGYGLSMLEAHTAGATLVATNAGIAPLLVSDTAKPGDVNDIARLLSKALSGQVLNKSYIYSYPSKQAYLEAYKRDIERESL
ncbi:MAG: glycosyltransferase [bacterium]|nr:glycosyltransferase [bacterium]